MHVNRQVVAPFCCAKSLLTCGLMLATVVLADDVAGQQDKPANATVETTRSAAARCSVRKESGRWWFVTPQGKRFFSLGICEFNQGSDKNGYDPARPSYAAWRHYGSTEEWAANNVQRLKTWGFTTLGGWSDFKTIAQLTDNGLWMTPVVNLGARSGAPWFDMWDEKVVRRIDELANETITPLRGNSRIIGYYSDNEIGWWNAILWKMTLEQPAGSGQRKQLIRTAREVYADDWDALVKDFEPQNAESWEEIERGGMLWLRPGSNGIRAMRRFLGVVAERYYELMHNAIHKYDPNALYLGDRYQSFYYHELASAARQHVDVVSTNLNASWNDGTFLRSYLDTLNKLTGRPLVVSEFYMAAEENGSGNQNKVGGFPTVATQRERRDAIAATLNSLARLPYLVGADWFQYYDEPPHGRKRDGEDYNFGLIDIHNRPYAEVTSAIAALNLPSLKSDSQTLSVDATAGIPPAPPGPLDGFQPMTAIKNWDRKRGFVPASNHTPAGDLYVCWSPTAIYLATYVIEIAEPDYYRDSKIPEIDRAAWTIRVNDRSPITIRVGAGKRATTDVSALRVASLSGTYHDVKCVTAVELPASTFGKERFAPGDRITLDSSFLTLGRANRIEWKGEFSLVK